MSQRSAGSSLRSPLSIILVSYDAERLHLALQAAASAAAAGRPVRVFFTKAALALLLPGGFDAVTSGDGESLARLSARQEAAGVAGATTLLEGLAALPVRLYACEDSMAVEGIGLADLADRPATTPTTLSALMEHGEGGDFLTL